MRNAYKMLLEIPEGKIPLWRLGRRWENNVKITFKYGIWVWGGFVWLRRGFSGVFF
jgi:hypothetical protein